MNEGPGTGRLFRSLHAPDTDGTLLALEPADLVTLRTVSLRADQPEPEAIDPDFEHLFAPIPTDQHPPDQSDRPIPAEQPAPPVEHGRIDAAHPDEVDLDEVDPDGVETDDDVFDQAAEAPEQPTRSAIPPRRQARLDAGLSAWAAALVIVLSTALVGVADVIVTGGLGWLTGGALVLASIYAAATVRPSQGYWVIVTPPLAFLLTTVTVGQVTVTGAGFLVRQGLLIPFTLGQNVVWIIGATVAAALVVGIRRRRKLADPGT